MQVSEPSACIVMVIITRSKGWILVPHWCREGEG